MKIFLKSLVFFTILFSLISCAPRGEHKTVDEILKISKNRFSLVADKSNIDELRKTVSLLEKLTSDSRGSNLKTNTQEVAKLLNELNKKSAFTVRPAMREIILQYLAIANNKESDLYNFASTKLLVSKTYSLIASELETTAFRL